MFEHIKKEAQKRTEMEREIFNQHKAGVPTRELPAIFHVTRSYIEAVIRCEEKNCN